MRPEALIGKGLGVLGGLVRDIGAEVKRTYEGCTLDTHRAIMKELFHPITKEEIEEQRRDLKRRGLHWEHHTYEDAGDLDHVGWSLVSDSDSDKTTNIEKS